MNFGPAGRPEVSPGPHRARTPATPDEARDLTESTGKQKLMAGKPVAYDCGLPSMNHGLLEGVEASRFWATWPSRWGPML